MSFEHYLKFALLICVGKKSKFESATHLTNYNTARKKGAGIPPPPKGDGLLPKNVMDRGEVLLKDKHKVDVRIFDYLVNRRAELGYGPDPENMTLTQVLTAFIEVVEEDLLAHGRVGYFHTDKRSLC